MPLFDMKCACCSRKVKDALLSHSERAAFKCPKCGSGCMHNIIGKTDFRLKGGDYLTKGKRYTKS